MNSEKNLNKIFVGGVPSYLNHEQAFKCFSQIVPSLTLVELPMVKGPNAKSRNKGFAILHMEDEKHFCKLLKEKFFHVKGRKVTMREYLRGGQLEQKKRKELQKRVFISKLPIGLSLDKVKTTFSTKFGSVEDLFRLVNPTTKKQKPCAYCFFTSENAASKALKAKKLTIETFKIKIDRFDSEMNEKFKKKVQKQETEASKRSTTKKSHDDASNLKKNKNVKSCQLLNQFMYKPTQKKYFQAERHQLKNFSQSTYNYRINQSQTPLRVRDFFSGYLCANTQSLMFEF